MALGPCPRRAFSVLARGSLCRRVSLRHHLQLPGLTSFASPPLSLARPPLAPYGPVVTYSRFLSTQHALCSRDGNKGPGEGDGGRVGSTAGAVSSSAGKRVGYVERVKVVIKEYGTVAVVFHTVISLASLGSCYLVVKTLACSSFSISQVHLHAVISYLLRSIYSCFLTFPFVCV